MGQRVLLTEFFPVSLPPVLSPVSSSGQLPRHSLREGKEEIETILVPCSRRNGDLGVSGHIRNRVLRDPLQPTDLGQIFLLAAPRQEPRRTKVKKKKKFRNRTDYCLF